MIFDAVADGRQVRVDVRCRDGRYSVSLDGSVLEIDLHEAGGDFLSLLVDGRSYEVGLEKRPNGYRVVFPDDALVVELQDGARGAVPRKAVSGPVRITAPMPGKLVRVLVRPGDEVAAGQPLVVIEAMKMQNELRAPRATRVKELTAGEGQAVETGALLVVLE